MQVYPVGTTGKTIRSAPSLAPFAPVADVDVGRYRQRREQEQEQKQDDGDRRRRDRRGLGPVPAVHPGLPGLGVVRGRDRQRVVACVADLGLPAQGDRRRFTGVEGQLRRVDRLVEATSGTARSPLKKLTRSRRVDVVRPAVLRGRERATTSRVSNVAVGDTPT